MKGTKIMKEKLEEIRERAKQELAAAAAVENVEELRIKYAGKKGRHSLLTAASIEGSFEDAEITSAEGGPKVAGAKVVVGQNEIYLTLPTGMLILFQ